MKQMLVGGGLLDFATLHPLGALLAVLVTVVVARWTVRTFGPGRHARTRRPPPPGGEGEGRRPASNLI
jgi:hypothetical protein